MKMKVKVSYPDEKSFKILQEILKEKGIEYEALANSDLAIEDIKIDLNSDIIEQINAIIFIKFIEEVERLKLVPRSGWWYYGIKHPETVAEHSFVVAFLTLILGNYLKSKGEALDIEKALEMAIIHEIGEVKIGDIHLEAKNYLSNVDDVELKVAEEFFSSEYFKNLLDTYREFYEGKSNEARLVRACDKLELFFQAYLYNKFGYKNLLRFWQTDENIKYISTIEITNIIYNFLKLLTLTK